MSRKGSSEYAWVDVLLSRWGRWSLRKGGGALGYASSSILAGAGRGDGHSDPSPPADVTDEDFEAVDSAIMTLPLVQMSCILVVYVHLAGKSIRQQAERLGITKEALGKYLVQAHRNIALDISKSCRQNPPHSVIGEIVPVENEPA